MATDNQVTLVGNLTDDPELRYTPNGAAVCKFRIAVNRRFQDANGQWKDGDTSYFTINAWRTMAENAAESLTRGTRVIVAGRLNYRTWENQDGDKRSAIEVEADEVASLASWLASPEAGMVTGLRRDLVGLGGCVNGHSPDCGTGPTAW